MMTMKQKQQTQASLLSLLITIIIPSSLLIFFKENSVVSSLQVVLIALAFPLSYSGYEWFSQKKVSFISILGFLSVLLTGGIAILKLPPEWIAIKESLIPFVIGCIVFGSCIRKKPVIHFILYSFLDESKIQTLCQQSGQEKKLLDLEIITTYIMSGSFFLSSFLNFVLATIIVKSVPGTPQFNQELGVLTALSYPIIAVPSMLVLGSALWFMIHHLKKLTQSSFTDLVKTDLID